MKNPTAVIWAIAFSAGAILACNSACNSAGDTVDDSLEEGDPEAVEDPFEEAETWESEPLEAVELEGWDSVAAATDKMEAPIQYSFPQSFGHFEVYQDAGTTLIQLHDPSEEPDFETASAYNLWLGGTRFDGGLMMRLEDPTLPTYYRAIESDFEEGKPVRTGMGEPYYLTYNNLEIQIFEGDDERTIEGVDVQQWVAEVSFQRTRTETPDAEEGRTERAEFRHVLWVAEEYPYAPSFAPVLDRAGRFFGFFANDGDIVGPVVYERVEEKLRDEGLVLGVESYQDNSEDSFFHVEAENLREVEPTDMEVEWRPVLDVDTRDALIGAAMFDEFVGFEDPRQAQSSRAILRYEAEAKGVIDAQVMYDRNDDGELYLLLQTSPADGGEVFDRELTLFLGLPAGDLASGDQIPVATEDPDIDAMSLAELRERAGQFGVLGVLREYPPEQEHAVIHPLMRSLSGTVTIDDADEALSGTIDITFEAPRIGAGLEAETITLHLEGPFHALRGLDRLPQSDVGSLLREREAQKSEAEVTQ